MVRFLAVGLLCEMASFLAAADVGSPVPTPPGRYGVCVCGSDCRCDYERNCGCGMAVRSAPPGTVRTNEGRLIRWTGSGWVFADGPAPAVQTFTPTTYAPFGTAAGGCANGSCGVPQQSRGGFFRR